MSYDGKETFERGLFVIVSWIFWFAVGFIICEIITRHKIEDIETNTTVIDSLTTVNDSIKIKVEKLDSIKNAKVIEVTTLDNDSTLKLFYELVSE